MILVLGGTTEGRRTVSELEEAGKPFYYSTKTGEQHVVLRHGLTVSGAMDQASMTAFCKSHDIRLLIDAAHPFALQLHQTVAMVAETLQMPAIRFERIFPERASDIVLCKDYDDAVAKISCHTLLATTGVQSIGRLKPLEERGISVVYRILNRESSIRLAHEQGATDRQLCFYEDGSTIDVEADAILLKESGTSGGYEEKVEVARQHGMKIYVLERPETPSIFHQVNGEHGLRRMVERLLPDFFTLKSGLTTGTCATAAAMAAATRLLSGQKPGEMLVTLPNGEQIAVGVGYGDDYAFVVKQSGDDPDVTNGLEIRASVALVGQRHSSADGPSAITIDGGEGVGHFTLPGFDYPPGEAAINRGPREMIIRNLTKLMGRQPAALHVTIAVPGGKEVAKRTFNPRLGIEGGISIIGVSGIVKPFSEEAFILSIRKCMQVAVASGTSRVVINSGAKSERFVRSLYPTLPRQAFVEYGNYIGETLRMAHELKVKAVTLGVMLGKAVKLAEGQLDTHSRRGVMNRAFVSQMLAEAGCPCDMSQITLARELWDILSTDRLNAFAQVVIAHCHRHCDPLLPQGSLTILLITDDGHIY